MYGNLLSNALMFKDYWGWQIISGSEGCGDVLIYVLFIFYVYGLFVAIHGALINGSKMIWLAKFDFKCVIVCMSWAIVFMGVFMLYVRMLAEFLLSKFVVQNMCLFIVGFVFLLIEIFAEWQVCTG